MLVGFCEAGAKADFFGGATNRECLAAHRTIMPELITVGGEDHNHVREAGKAAELQRSLHPISLVRMRSIGLRAPAALLSQKCLDQFCSDTFGQHVGPRPSMRKRPRSHDVDVVLQVRRTRHAAPSYHVLDGAVQARE